VNDRLIEVHEVFAADWARLASMLADLLTDSPASAAALSRRNRIWPETVIADLREHAALLTESLEGTHQI
jgi:hypothetical protein